MTNTELITIAFHNGSLGYAASFEYLRHYDSNKGFGFDYIDEQIIKQIELFGKVNRNHFTYLESSEESFRNLRKEKLVKTKPLILHYVDEHRNMYAVGKNYKFHYDLVGNMSHSNGVELLTDVVIKINIQKVGDEKSVKPFDYSLP